MPEIDAVIAFRPLNRPVVNREGHSVALPERHDLGAALHPRTLLCQDELAAREVPVWFGKKYRDLEREGEIPIQILVQTIEIPGGVLK